MGTKLVYLAIYVLLHNFWNIQKMDFIIIYKVETEFGFVKQEKVSNISLLNEEYFPKPHLCKRITLLYFILKNNSILSFPNVILKCVYVLLA